VAKFQPKSILLYGIDCDGIVNLSNKADALASTANFLKDHGWVQVQVISQASPTFQRFRFGTLPAFIRTLSRNWQADRRVKTDGARPERYRDLEFPRLIALCDS
jgi:Transglycosylase SLT domain